MKISNRSRSTGSFQPGSLIFSCNICDSLIVRPFSDLGRETNSCDSCDSTVRVRGMIHVLSSELFGRSIPLSQFPTTPEIIGVGMSDWEGYASVLAEKFNYKNTYYHQEPRLDICNVSSELNETLNFITSSDVFEHVAPPISKAFEGTFGMLKPGGVLVLSVPYHSGPNTIEHFPRLHKYELIENNGKQILRNITEDGTEEVFENLVFHGGVGATLEMRVFSERDLINDLEKAGFREIKIHKAPDFQHGVYWEYDWAIVMSARK